MLGTLTIVSEGYLKCGNPLQIAVDGYLDNCDTPPIPPKPEPIPPIGGGGGTSAKGRGIAKREYNKEIDLQNEDEEIMVIIKAFVECQ